MVLVCWFPSSGSGAPVRIPRGLVHKNYNPRLFRGIQPGTVVYTDSNAAILEYDPSTGQRSLISKGGLLKHPYGITLLENSDVLVGDTGAQSLIRIDKDSGQQSLFAQNSTLGFPFGITTDKHGDIWVANGEALVRVDKDTAATRTISSGQLFLAPIGVAVGEDNTAYIADAVSRIIKVNTHTGEQTLLSSGGYLVNPIGIVTVQNDLFVADSGAQKVIHISTKSGKQTLLSAGGNLCSPVAVAIYGQSQLLIGDPDAFNYSGCLLEVNMSNGAQSPLVTGAGEFVNPRCLVVVPSR